MGDNDVKDVSDGFVRSGRMDMAALVSKLPAVVVLDKSKGVPTNGIAWRDSVARTMSMLDCTHLSYAEFNVQAVGSLGAGKLALLRKKISEVSSSSSGVKLEPGVFAPLAASSLDMSVEATAVHFKEAPMFNDPLSGDFEDKSERYKRLVMFDRLKQSCVGYPLLLSQSVTGDIAAALKLIMSLIFGTSEQSVIKAMVALGSLAKPPSHSWESFTAEVLGISQALDGAQDSRLHLGSRILPLFVLRALDADPRLSVEVALLRRIGPDVTTERIINDIGVKMMQLGPVSAPIVGAVGAVAKRPCFKFRDQGACQFGDKCRFSHDRKAGKPKTASSSTRGACYECGSTQHGIQSCPDFKRRKDAEKAQGNSALANSSGVVQPIVSKSPEGASGISADVAVLAPGAELSVYWVDPEFLRLLGR